jgi:hypothetical protein
MEVRRKTKTLPFPLSTLLISCLNEELFLELRSVSLTHDLLQMNIFTRSRVLGSGCLLPDLRSPYTHTQANQRQSATLSARTGTFLGKNNSKGASKTAGKKDLLNMYL